MRMNKRMINIASNALSFNISFLRIKKSRVSSPHDRLNFIPLFLLSALRTVLLYRQINGIFFSNQSCYLIHTLPHQKQHQQQQTCSRPFALCSHIFPYLCHIELVHSYKEIALDNFGSARFGSLINYINDSKSDFQMGAKRLVNTSVN